MKNLNWKLKNKNQKQEIKIKMKIKNKKQIMKVGKECFDNVRSSSIEPVCGILSLSLRNFSRKKSENV